MFHLPLCPWAQRKFEWLHAQRAHGYGLDVKFGFELTTTAFPALHSELKLQQRFASRFQGDCTDSSVCVGIAALKYHYYCQAMTASSEQVDLLINALQEQAGFLS